MSDKLLAWLLGRKRGGYNSAERLLRQEHFEFRGGESDADPLSIRDS